MSPIPIEILEGEVDCESFASPGFEGPEKRLEVYFRPLRPENGKFNPSEGLRTLNREQWSEILVHAQCSILSQKSNEFFDAYLLSESSLFVYATKFMIKTCGTTTLLKVIPEIIAVAKELNMEMDYMQYSRASFTFPNQQLHPHTSFQSEVDYLNTFFRGESYVLGSADGARQWLLYIAGECQIRTADQCFEVFMFDLDEDVMKHFFNVDPDGTERFGTKHGSVTSDVSGISSIMSKGSLLDAYNFEPCGYSMNGLEEKSYYTIHITPEPHCSYVSFECILPLNDFTELLDKVLNVFKPRKFSVAFHADITAPAGIDGLKHWNAADTQRIYQSVGDNTFLRMKTASGHEVTATLCSYVTTACELPVTPSPLTPRTLRHCSEGLKEVMSRFPVKVEKYGDSLQIIRNKTIKMSALQKPMHIIDLSSVSQRIDLLLCAMNKYRELRYSVNLNADPAVLRLLDYAGCIFEGQSIDELDHLKDAGVKAEHAILTDPICGLSCMERVQSQFGTIRIFDDMDRGTIMLIGQIFRGATVELHLMSPLDSSVETVARTAEAAVVNATDAGLIPVGISFDLGSCGAKPSQFRRALEVSHRIVSFVLRPDCPVPSETARMLKRLSVGQSFPGSDSLDDHEFLAGLNLTFDLVNEFFPASSGMIVALDPGRFVVSSSHSLLVSVVARRDVREGQTGCITYYVNDGIDGSFRRWLKRSKFDPVLPDPICFVESEHTPSKVMGSSCSDADHLWTGDLPRLQVGDQLLFTNLGTYAHIDPLKHKTYYFVVDDEAMNKKLRESMNMLNIK